MQKEKRKENKPKKEKKKKEIDPYIFHNFSVINTGLNDGFYKAFCVYVFKERVLIGEWVVIYETLGHCKTNHKNNTNLGQII